MLGKTFFTIEENMLDLSTGVQMKMIFMCILVSVYLRCGILKYLMFAD
jgi:hypothetical protein